MAPTPPIYENAYIGSPNERSVDVTETVVPIKNETFKGQQQNPAIFKDSSESPKVYEFESVIVDVSDDFLKSPSSLSESKFLNKTESYENSSFIINLNNLKEFDEYEEANVIHANLDEEISLKEKPSPAYSMKLEKKQGLQTAKPNSTLADLLPQILNDKDDIISLTDSLRNEQTHDDRLTEERVDAEFEQAISGNKLTSRSLKYNIIKIFL